MALDENTIYQALAQFAINSEQTRWNRLYNFLTANSILILSWAAVFVGIPSRLSACFLLTVSLLGAASGVFWATLSYRGTRFLHLFNGIGAAMESGAMQTAECRPFQAQIVLSGDMTLRLTSSNPESVSILGNNLLQEGKSSFHAKHVEPILQKLCPYAEARIVLSWTPLAFSALYVCLTILGLARLAFGAAL